MTWINRLKLVVGLIAVVVVVAAFTVVFNQRQHRVVSTSATIVAQSYPVGTDYAGIVVRQHVEIGSAVTAGDVLFEVRSLQLQRDIASGYVVDADVRASLTQDGTSIVNAMVDGVVTDVAVPQGGFAQAGGVLATIDRDESLFVEAEFLLSPRDYARITTGSVAELVLPSQAVLAGEVTRIEVETVEGQARSTVVVASDDLRDSPAAGLFQAGTPVSVTLRLRDDGPLAGVADAVHDLLRKVGL